jgi:hypothetical protein
LANCTKTPQQNRRAFTRLLPKSHFFIQPVFHTQKETQALVPQKRELVSPMLIQQRTTTQSQRGTAVAHRQNPGLLPCSVCGSQQRKLGAGKALGEASLLCADCGKFIKWISVNEVAIASQLNKGGQC